MIDSLYVVGRASRAPGGFEWLHRAGASEVKYRAVDDGDGGLHGCSATAIVPGLGRILADESGDVWAGRSLVHTFAELVTGEVLDNSVVLSRSEAEQAYSALVGRLSEVVRDLREVEVRRADVVYQRSVPSSAAVIGSLVGALKPTRKGQALFDNGQGVPTGLMLQGRAVAHRLYDKGLESGGPANNVLRSEEQLRAGSAGLRRIMCEGSGSVWDEAECRALLNERVASVTGEGVDVRELVAAPGGSLTLALFALHPELLAEYKDRVSRSRYYAMRREVREYRGSRVGVDLSVPDGGWEVRNTLGGS